MQQWNANVNPPNGGYRGSLYAVNSHSESANLWLREDDSAVIFVTIYSLRQLDVPAMLLPNVGNGQISSGLSTAALCLER